MLQAPQFGLDDIIINSELSLRPERTHDLRRECKALESLTQTAAEHPPALLQQVVDLAVEICGAGSAGVSLLESEANGEQVFRWVAVGGAFKPYTGGTTPCDWSPYRICLDRDMPMLYSYPARFFTYFNQVEPPIVEGLMIPFHVDEEAVGTIWIVSHAHPGNAQGGDSRGSSFVR
jgi:hypothetical protein